MVSETGSLLEGGKKSRELMRPGSGQWQEVKGMEQMPMVAEGLREEPGFWLTKGAAYCLIPRVHGRVNGCVWAS